MICKLNPDLDLKAYTPLVEMYEAYYGKGNVRYRFENLGPRLTLRFYKIIKETKFTVVVQEAFLAKCPEIRPIDMNVTPRRMYKRAKTSYTRDTLQGALTQFLYRKRKEASLLSIRLENNKIVSDYCETLAKDLGLQTLSS